MSILRVLRDVGDLLRSEGRLSLRLVQREFELTDDDLDTVVDELVNVRGEATLDGTVLTVRATQSGDDAGDRSGVSTPPDEALSPGDTEHRDLTVLFCDLVGSTELSTRLDAEDFGEAVRAYHQVVTSTVAEFGGHVANLMGDGLLVLFGYPTAHDDSGRQAVAAALAAVDAVERRALGIEVRVGLHVGPVVISNIGPGGRSGALTLGETVNVAARVESAARPGSVYITDDLADLVDGWFEIESAGFPSFKGFDRPIEVHRVAGATGARSAIEARGERGLSPLTGRDAELATIGSAWADVLEGNGRVGGLLGEPGIGKSRLVAEVRDSIVRKS